MGSVCSNASPGLVGESPAICQIRRHIEKLAHSRSAVLLLGESGTGKEIVARAINNGGGVGHFIPIDCGSLVGPLMESELFGHVRGAFTGAADTKRGLIELADGGTAFFDEIGDLPLEMQVKLLRLLQEREFRAVGSLTTRKVEIRVIAATHRDLIREIEHQNYRRTCSTGSTSSRCGCRRCANAGRTSRCSSSAFWSGWEPGICSPTKPWKR